MPFLTILGLLRKRSTWIALLVSVGVILAGFAVVNYVSVKSRNTVLTAELSVTKDQLKQMQANNVANQKAIITRNELVTALAQVETVERVRTVEALKANPNWASQPIPADVLASLRR